MTCCTPGPICHADKSRLCGKAAFFAGNATNIGSLLFNFAYLRGFLGDYPALTPSQQASLATLASQTSHQPLAPPS